MRRAATWLALMGALALPSIALALPPVSREPQCHGLPAASGPVRVRWASITRTQTCWFFSGPGDLGRDDHLGESAQWSRIGDRVSLRFDRAVFEGTIAGGRVSLRRVSRHAEGAGWSVTETIEGTLAATPGSSGGADGCATLVGRYHYDECDTAGGACPGHCHIDAAITIEGP